MTPFHHEIVIGVPAHVVYRHLTERAGLQRWIGSDAAADPVAGGDLRWVHHNGATMIGRFVELVPDRRIVFRYGWQGNLMGVPPESTLVEIDLHEHDDCTTLILTHHGLPTDSLDEHAQGWQHFLGQLAQLLAE